MTFFERLERRARAVDSLLCVGLDPHAADVRAAFGDASAPSLVAYCRRIIDATAPVAAAYKPNAAFFEAAGPEGAQALHAVIAAVPDDIPVILDAKRGDIASTARAYADAAFDGMGADALTVNPYLGRDAVTPFLERADRGVFLLCRTSNPGSADFQALRVEGRGPLYEEVARRSVEWNENGNLGLVVGATQPASLARIRALAPDTWILLPGVGAQGGDLRAALAAGLRADGWGLLVNASRGIARAEDPGRAARELCEAIREARETLPSPGSLPLFDAELADGLLDAGCVRFGDFTLKSGKKSPIYLDLRLLVSHPPLLARAAAAYVAVMRGLRFDRVAAIPHAGLPIGTAVGLCGGWPLVYPRREAKSYGCQATVEGTWVAGERMALLDDLATTAGSKVEAIEKLESVGLSVKDVVVLVDRESGAKEAMAAMDCRLHAVFTLTALIDHWAASGRISAVQAAAVRDFLAAERGAGAVRQWSSS